MNKYVQKIILLLLEGVVIMSQMKSVLMTHIFFIIVLLCLNQQLIITFQLPPIISNKSFSIEEYGTIKFDCPTEQRLLAAWRLSLRHDNIYRYYYINPNLQSKFFQSNENEDKPRDVLFENNLHTMIFLNVRQWINSAFETIECVLYNDQINRLERRLFYLNVYVTPSSFSLNINHLSQEDRSIFFVDNNEQLTIFCEIYSYPKSILQFSLNNQIISANETIDCFNDDLSTILLSNSLCLSQSNWRIRVRIHTILSISKINDQQNFTCSVAYFPYGNAWKYSTSVQLIERKEISTKLSTSSSASIASSSITQQRITHSGLLTLSTTQTTIIKQSTNYLQEYRFWQIVLICFTLIIAFILVGYLAYKNKRKKVFSIKPTSPI